MSAADRSAGTASVVSDVAGLCRDASFVRFVTSADGDALAATGVLARALSAMGCPFQASVAAPTADPARSTDADATLAIGHVTPTADYTLTSTHRSCSEIAYRAVGELGQSGDPVLALAGASVAEQEPSGDLREAAERAGASRRPGVAAPTTDVGRALASSTRLLAPFSGDPDAVRAALGELGLQDSPGDDGTLAEDDRRRLASMVAVRTVAPDEATARAGERVEDALRPHAIDGPFATVEGYGDVLDAVARERPGTGVALALGHDATDAALDAWRRHGERVHSAIDRATTARYDGVFVARVEGEVGNGEDAISAPLGTIARLLRDFRSPEPVALVVSEGTAAAAATDDVDLAATARTAAATVAGEATGSGTRARATFEDEPSSFVTAFREAL